MSVELLDIVTPSALLEAGVVNPDIVYFLCGLVIELSVVAP